MESVFIHWLGGGTVGVIATWALQKFGPGFLDAAGGAIFQGFWETVRTKLGFKEKRKKARRIEDQVQIGALQQKVKDLGLTIKDYGRRLSKSEKETVAIREDLSNCETSRAECLADNKNIWKRLYAVEKKTGIKTV